MRSWSPAKRGRAILVSFILILVGALLIAARAAMFPFVIGIFLVYLLLPAVNLLDGRMPTLLRERRLSRPLSIMLIYLGVALLLVGFFAIFVPVVSDQISDLVAAASGQYAIQLSQLSKMLNQTALNDALERFYDYVPDVVREAVEQNIQQATAFLTSALQDLISWFVSTIQKALLGTLNVVTSTVGFFLGIVIIPFWVFYLLNDQKRVSANIYVTIPETYRDDVYSLETIISESFGGYIRGQLFLCLVVGAMSTLGLAIMGINFSVLLGTMAGIFEIIPNIGPFLGAIPAILVALLESPALAVQAAILFLVIQQVENTFLVPKVVGASVQLHPTAVMVILVVGNAVAGIWGMVLGVPMTAIARDVFRYLYLRFSDEEISPQEALVRVHPPREDRAVELPTWQQKLVEWGHSQAWVASAQARLAKARDWAGAVARAGLLWSLQRVHMLRTWIAERRGAKATTGDLGEPYDTTLKETKS